MIRLNLNRILAKLAYETNSQPLSVESLADETGYHRNSITKVLKTPEENTTTGIIDALLQVVFRHFRKSSQHKEISDDDLMKMLLNEFVQVIPDKDQRKKKPSRKATTKKAKRKKAS